MEKRQICHAHLKRDFTKIAERKGPGQAIGEALCEKEAEVFHVHHLFKDNALSREQLQEQLLPIAATIEDLLLHGKQCGDSKVEGMCKDIYAHKEALWTFAAVADVEPTNNLAEQAVRPYVLWRRGSFGTQSERGSRFVERMASVIQTCRRQGRNLIAFLVRAVDCWNHGVQSPSLIVHNST